MMMRLENPIQTNGRKKFLSVFLYSFFFFFIVFHQTTLLSPLVLDSCRPSIPKARCHRVVFVIVVIESDVVFFFWEAPIHLFERAGVGDSRCWKEGDWVTRSSWHCPEAKRLYHHPLGLHRVREEGCPTRCRPLELPRGLENTEPSVEQTDRDLLSVHVVVEAWLEF